MYVSRRCRVSKALNLYLHVQNDSEMKCPIPGVVIKDLHCIVLLYLPFYGIWMEVQIQRITNWITSINKVKYGILFIYSAAEWEKLRRVSYLLKNKMLSVFQTCSHRDMCQYTNN